MISGNSKHLKSILPMVVSHIDLDLQDINDAFDMLSAQLNESTFGHLFENNYSLQVYLSEVLMATDLAISRTKEALERKSKETDVLSSEIVLGLRDNPPVNVRVTEGYLQAKVAKDPEVNKLQNETLELKATLNVLTVFRDHLNRAHFISTGRGSTLKEYLTRLRA